MERGYRFFFTLFTRATPGTPASIYIYIYIYINCRIMGQLAYSMCVGFDVIGRLDVRDIGPVREDY